MRRCAALRPGTAPCGAPSPAFAAAAADRPSPHDACASGPRAPVRARGGGRSLAASRLPRPSAPVADSAAVLAPCRHIYAETCHGVDAIFKTFILDIGKVKQPCFDKSLYIIQQDSQVFTNQISGLVIFMAGNYVPSCLTGSAATAAHPSLISPSQDRQQSPSTSQAVFLFSLPSTNCSQEITGCSQRPVPQDTASPFLLHAFQRHESKCKGADWIKKAPIAASAYTSQSHLRGVDVGTACLSAPTTFSSSGHCLFQDTNMQSKKQCHLIMKISM
ncbi:hypothetical protein U9M48_029605 [Paspalum notatum var. saurae]|uniref:Uncharacterized protein n=1 Tax=Paspalum notatum var. saurae TaxID=547442 RepID=A0AAQ3TYW1_PASNO